MSSFTFQPCRKTHLEKTSKEIAENTKIGLRTVQRISKNWKDSGEPSSSREKCGRKKKP